MGSDIFVDNQNTFVSEDSILPSTGGGDGLVNKEEGEIEEKIMTKGRNNDLTEEFGSQSALLSHFGKGKNSEYKAQVHALHKGRQFSLRDQQSLVNTHSYRGCSGKYDFEKDSEVGDRNHPKICENLPYRVIPTFHSKTKDYIIHFMEKKKGEKPSLKEISFYLKRGLRSLFRSSEEAYDFASEYGFGFTGEDKEKLFSSHELFEELIKKLEFQKLMAELKKRLEEKHPLKKQANNCGESSNIAIERKDDEIWLSVPELNMLEEGVKITKCYSGFRKSELRFDVPNGSSVDDRGEGSKEIFFNIPDGKF